MERVSAQSRARRTKWAVLEECRRAVAEMQAALGDARDVGQQAGHGMSDSVRID